MLRISTGFHIFKFTKDIVVSKSCSENNIGSPFLNSCHWVVILTCIDADLQAAWINNLSWLYYNSKQLWPTFAYWVLAKRSFNYHGINIFFFFFFLGKANVLLNGTYIMEEQENSFFKFNINSLWIYFWPVTLITTNIKNLLNFCKRTRLLNQPEYQDNCHWFIKTSLRCDSKITFQNGTDYVHYKSLCITQK